MERVLVVTGASSAIGGALIRQIAGNYDTVFAHYNRGEERVRALCGPFDGAQGPPFDGAQGPPFDGAQGPPFDNSGAQKTDAEPVEASGQRQTQGPRVIPVQADFADEQSTLAMIDRIRESGKMPTHIVHLSALRASWKKFAKFSWEDYQKEIDTDLRPAVLLAKAFAPEMAKQRYGRFVFMLSAYTCGADPKYMSPYITAKYALLGLMKNLAAEYGEKNVHFNATSPEMIDTPFVENVPEPARRMAAEQAPSGKLLAPETVADAVAYLLSDEASRQNGCNLYLDATGKRMMK